MFYLGGLKDGRKDIKYISPWARILTYAVILPSIHQVLYYTNYYNIFWCLICI